LDALNKELDELLELFSRRGPFYVQPGRRAARYSDGLTSREPVATIDRPARRPSTRSTRGNRPRPMTRSLSDYTDAEIREQLMNAAEVRSDA
jgi:hypothetical protein